VNCNALPASAVASPQVATTLPANTVATSRAVALPTIVATASRAIVLSAITVTLPSLQRYVVTSWSVGPPPAIAATTAKLCTSDVNRTFVGRPSDFRRIFVELPSDFRLLDFRPQTSIRRSCVLLSYCHVVLRHAPTVLRPISYCPTYYFVILPSHPTSVWLPSDLRPTFVWPPCNLCVSWVIPINALYSSNCTLC